MKLILELLVITVSVLLVVWGVLGAADTDFHPVWRRVIGYAMVIVGLQLFRHGQNYLSSMP